MSRIIISDLAIDSNSFINEVAETEAAFVNGGIGLNFDKFSTAFGNFGIFALTLLFETYKVGAGIAALLDILDK